MNGMAELVRREIEGLLHRRRDLVIMAVRHRAKFEGWLKFELGAVLEARLEIESVEPERGYGKNDRCDLACDTGTGTWLIELKTASANWRIEGVVTKTRPITNHVDGIITDIEKLRRGCRSERGLAAFLFFPVTRPVWDSPKRGLNYHLNRIEREAELVPGALRKNDCFVELTENLGVAVFVIETP